MLPFARNLLRRFVGGIFTRGRQGGFIRPYFFLAATYDRPRLFGWRTCGAARAFIVAGSSHHPIFCLRRRQDGSDRGPERQSNSREEHG